MHLARDISRITHELFAICGLVEEAIALAIRALVERREELARQVIAGDSAIDRREVVLEEDILKVLALHQPVARDLRFVITALKVNNDLERMGDLASNIAQRSKHLGRQDPLNLKLDMSAMAAKVQTMVRRSLQSLVELDSKAAREVLGLDDEIDDLHRDCYVELRGLLETQPATAERALDTLSVSRNLERMADLATNIAEDVIFMVEGDVVRHAPPEDNHRD